MANVYMKSRKLARIVLLSLCVCVFIHGHCIISILFRIFFTVANFICQ